jgi:hypothetical protein
MRFSIRKLNPFARPRNLNAIFILLCILISLFIIAISVSVSFVLVTSGLNHNITSYDIGMNVDFELLNIDPVAGIVAVDIYPWFNSPDQDAAPNCTGNSTARTFDVYIDQNLSATGNPNWEDSENKDVPNNNRPNKPVFRYTDDPCNPDERKNIATVRRILKLFLNAPTEGQERAAKYGQIGNGLQAYPFDKYFANIYLFALETTNNQSTPQPLGLGDARGAVSNFQADFDLDTDSVEQGLTISLSIERSRAILLFCMVIIVANWIITLVFLWTTVACMLWKEQVVKELFVIPVSVLFAFTAVRGSMPGAPAGFGAFIDFVGILPNLAVLTVCSFILIFLIMLERIRDANAREKGLDAEKGGRSWSSEEP